MTKEMNELRGLGVLAAAKAAGATKREAKRAEAVVPVIPGIRKPGGVAKGAPLASAVTTKGRALRRADPAGLMLSHMPKETLALLSPGQRSALEHAFGVVNKATKK